MVATAVLYCLYHRSGLHEVTAAESEGISTLILLIGSIYAVMFAFVIYVIWGQFTDVQNFMMRECKSLNEVLRFADFLNPDAARSIRRSVADYVQRVVKSEWAALGESDRLIELVEAAKLRRLRSGATKRERAQIEIVDGPPILGKIMRDPGSNARHVIDAVKVLDGLASTGAAEAAPK